MTFPSLGHGVGLRLPHYERALSGALDVDWVEVISENFFGGGGRPRAVLEAVRRDRPLVFHGVSLGVGSFGDRSRYLRQLRALAHDFEPAWISDHVCWTCCDGRESHELLPLPFTEEALAVAVDNTRRAQDALGRPIVLENVSSYVRFAASQLTEWEFLAELAARSGCSLLLDLNNIVVSAFNHGFSPKDYLAGLSPHQVVQFHLANHSHHPHHKFDDHRGPVPDAVWALYEAALHRFGAVSSLVEWDDDIPTWERLVAERDEAARRARRVLGDAASVADVRNAREAPPLGGVVLAGPCSRARVPLNHLSRESPGHLCAPPRAETVAGTSRDAEGCDAESRDAEGCDAEGCDAEGCDAESCDAEGCDAEGCDAEGCDAEGCDAEGCDAEGCDAEGCDAESLEAVQRLFFAALAWPTGVRDFASVNAARGRELERLLSPPRDGDGLERLDIYANAYFHRQLDALRSTFPRLERLAGAVVFHDLVTDYVLECPSDDPDLQHRGDRLPAFVRAHAIGRTCPLLGDVAELELGLAHALDAPDAEPLAHADLARLAANDWPRLALSLVPSVRLVRASYDLEATVRLCDAGELTRARDAARLEASAAPAALELRCLVFRRDHRVFFRNLAAGEALALSLVSESARFDALCERLAASGTGPVAIVEWLSRWIDEGLLAVGFVRGGKPREGASTAGGSEGSIE